MSIIFTSLKHDRRSLLDLITTSKSSLRCYILFLSMLFFALFHFTFQFHRIAGFASMLSVAD